MMIFIAKESCSLFTAAPSLKKIRERFFGGEGAAAHRL